MSLRPLSRCLGAAVAALYLVPHTLAVQTDRTPQVNGKTTTSWIPITTAFPLQPGCSDQIWSYVPNTLAAWDPGYGISVMDKNCLPRAATTWWDAERLGPNTLTTISIGPITCPQAYYTASTSVKDGISTLVGCCPSGYSFFDFKEPGDTGQCWSNLTAGQVITYQIRDASQSWSAQTTTITALTTIAGIPVNGWNVAATATGNSANENGGAASSRAPDELSPGAKAGIALGVTFGVLGLATLAAGGWMLHRARQQMRGRPAVPGAPAGGYVGEYVSMMAEHRQQPPPPPPPPPPQQQQHAYKVATLTTTQLSGSSGPASPAAMTTMPRSPTSYTSRSNPWVYHGGAGTYAAPGPGSSSSSSGNGDLATEQMGHAVMPVDATEMPVVVSPVLHPGDLQPQGYGPPSWKPGAVYR